MKFRLLILCMVLSLAACDKATQPPPPQAKLFKDQREALDKSKQVEDTVSQAAQDQQKKIDEQTQ